MPDVVITRSEFPDSIEIGTPGRGGNIKVYFNASNFDETKKRVDNAVEARTYLLNRLAGAGAG